MAMMDWNKYREQVMGTAGSLAEVLGMAIALNAGAALADSTRVMDACAGEADPPGTVEVASCARLHLGFLDLNFSLGRRFGSIGMLLDGPVTRLSLAALSRRA